MRCLPFHDWKWKQGIGRSTGTSLSGTCKRCGKTKFVPYAPWLDSRVQGAELLHPIKTLNAPPARPGARSPLYPPVEGLVATQSEREVGVGARIAPASLPPGVAP